MSGQFMKRAFNTIASQSKLWCTPVKNVFRGKVCADKPKLQFMNRYCTFNTIANQPKLRDSYAPTKNVFHANDCVFRPKNNNCNYKVVMVRHGESEWNQKNLFCGWYDADLSTKGVEEAKNAGRTLKRGNYVFDVAHTSVLKRAQRTLCTILEELGQTDVPVHTTWRLNERHYGGLTGLDKAQTAAKYGEEQVKIWRRSFDIPPPPMTVDNEYYDEIVCDPRYADGPSQHEFPVFESLQLTIQRTIPYWNRVIIPQMKLGKRIIIAAHGNSLRGIIKHLDHITDDAIMDLNLPTGIPFEYTFDKDFQPVVSMKFLADEETVKKATDAVSSQGKAK